MTELSQHNATNITLTKTRELENSGALVRDLVIEHENGEDTKVTIYGAEDVDELEVEVK